MKFSRELRCIAAAAALCVAGAAQAETLRNDDVVMLPEAGLGEEAVIAKIEASDGDFVIDTQTLLALRAKGVPSPVIAAMVKSASGTTKYDDTSPDPKVPHTPAFTFSTKHLPNRVRARSIPLHRPRPRPEEFSAMPSPAGLPRPV